MTKTKPESDFILVRPKRDSATRAAFSILNNTGNHDHTESLKDHVFLQMKEEVPMCPPMEEWVHKDDYAYYQELHKRG
jgi:hypothetical protein